MPEGFLRRYKTSVSVIAVIVALAAAYTFPKAQVLAADPQGEKNCAPTLQRVDNSLPDVSKLRAIPALEGVRWKQLGGTINDASCLNRIDIYGVIEVQSKTEIRPGRITHEYISSKIRGWRARQLEAVHRG